MGRAPADEGIGLPHEPARQQVLRDGERRDKTESLVHDGNAVPVELARRQRQGQIHPRQRHRSPVRRIDAGQHLDERRLARAIMAEEAMDLAMADRKRDIVDNLGTAEGLRQSLDDQIGGPGRRLDHYCRPQSLR
ncbi:MAG: hypothetical protein BGO06_11590 [Shinella sp. 65-6]|nr:MAG: hypothetical protein BGO06_11590 [Shinella sp. 65-6]